jgi:hypothetical protein
MFPWVLEALAADKIRSLLVLFFVPVYADFGCFRASFGNFDEGIAFHSAAWIAIAWLVGWGDSGTVFLVWGMGSIAQWVNVCEFVSDWWLLSARERESLTVWKE